ncbi:MAG: hypothetical protein ACE37F_04800 [Nannocystaceae bacterium]|nr:hypothetical protein [bacterium]
MHAVLLSVTVALTASRAPRQPPQHEPGEQHRNCHSKRQFSCCTTDASPCVRTGAARLTLFGVGVLAGGTAATMLFALGDRNNVGDPATFLVGGGAIAGAGALLGALIGRLGGDGPGDPDRIRPSTMGIDYRVAQPGALDETHPHQMRMTFAPNYFFPGDGGRLRIFGHVGGTLWQERQVDPRPQFQQPIEGQLGTAPVALRERRLSIGVGADLAVNLPYPVFERSSFLGAAELRYKPEFQIRRETLDAGLPSQRIVERSMLLPLTVGARWRLSQRQRFTVYFGPRFDVVSYAEPGEDSLQRGSAEIGPLYGEAWYDVDFPMTQGARRDGAQRRATVNSQLSVGYVHSRFDGRGVNFGPVIGFLGPTHLRWTTRVRPKAWPVALQAGAGLVIGNGISGALNVGVVLPDLGERP